MQPILVGALTALLALLEFAQPARAAVVPVPESQQAALALKIISAYDGKAPATPHKVLRVTYFTPADRDPIPKYQERLEAILEDLRTFYRSEMERHGFGAKTFELERDSDGKFIVHLVRGAKTAKGYADKWEARRQLIGGECEAALAPKKIWFSNETVAVVCNLANWDPQTRSFTHPSPYSGDWSRTGGSCWLMDSPILNLDFLSLK